MESQLESIIVNCQKCEKNFEVMQSQLVWRKNCISCWRGSAIASFWDNCRENEKVKVKNVRGDVEKVEKVERVSTNTKRINKCGNTGIVENGKGFRATWSYKKKRINIGTYPTIPEAVQKRRQFIINFKKEVRH
jgi:hypothetical protein